MENFVYKFICFILSISHIIFRKLLSLIQIIFIFLSIELFVFYLKETYVHRNPFTCYNTTEYTKVDGTGVHKTNTFLLDFKRIARSYLRILIEIELISCFMHTGAFRIKILLSHEFNYFVNFTLLYVHFFLYYSANFSIQDEETRSHLNLYHDNRKLLFMFYKMKDGLKLKKKEKNLIKMLLFVIELWFILF